MSRTLAAHRSDISMFFQISAARPILIKARNDNLPSNILLLALPSFSGQNTLVLKDKGHSLFSYFLILGISGHADSNDGQIISIGELHAYISNNYEKLGHNKLPTISGSLVYVLVSGTNRTSVVEGLKPSEHVSQKIQKVKSPVRVSAPQIVEKLKEAGETNALCSLFNFIGKYIKPSTFKNND